MILIGTEKRAKFACLGGDLDMELNPAELGLYAIIVAALIGPFAIKRVKQNLEAFLFLMGICAIAVSRSWHVDFIEESFQSPVMLGMVLSMLVAGAIIRYRGMHFKSLNDFVGDEITLKVVFFEIVVVLGLLASIVTPVLPFFVLVEVVNLLPIQRPTRAILMMLAGLSVGLGASLGPGGAPFSAIALTKMQGNIYPTSLIHLTGMLSAYLLPCILLLGLISTVLSARTALKERPASECKVTLKGAATWCVRACMFLVALLLVGGAFGINF
jgi:predicted cation transporter